MRALAIVKENHLEIVQKEVPEVSENEVLIKLVTAGINHRDQWIRQGMYPGIKLGTTLGSDGYGSIEKVGSNISKEWLGKNVLINPNINWGENPEVQSNDYHILGMPSDGTFSEYVKVNVDRLHPAPSFLSDEEQAAIPLVGLTAYRALFTQGKVEKKHNVLITGIGGGVAQMTFLMAKAVGCKVSVTSGSKNKLDYYENLGASGLFNYKDDNWHKQALKEQSGFDLIIDSTGGKSFSKYIDLVSPGGKVVFYGASAGMPDKVDLFKLFWKQATLQGSTMGNDQEFSEMLKFIEAHKIKPIIDNVYPLENWEEAFDRIKESKQLGKIILKL